MQCHLNGVHIEEVTTVLADNLSVTTNSSQLVGSFVSYHPLIISLQSSGVTNYFDVYSPKYYRI